MIMKYRVMVKTAVPTALNPREDDFEYDWVDYTGELYDSEEEAQGVIEKKNLRRLFLNAVIKEVENE